MFDVGILELFIVAVIALLVLGPERLPKAAQQAGRWIGQAKRMMSQWSDEVNRQIDNEEFRKQLSEKTSLGQLDKEIGSIHQSISQSLSGNDLHANDTKPTTTTPDEVKASA